MRLILNEVLSLHSKPTSSPMSSSPPNISFLAASQELLVKKPDEAGMRGSGCTALASSCMHNHFMDIVGMLEARPKMRTLSPYLGSHNM